MENLTPEQLAFNKGIDLAISLHESYAEGAKLIQDSVMETKHKGYVAKLKICKYPLPEKLDRDSPLLPPKLVEHIMQGKLTWKNLKDTA